jgi:hypothetical protein
VLAEHLQEGGLREAGWISRLRTDGKRTTAAGELIGYVLNIGERDLRISVEDSIKELALAAPVVGTRIGDNVRASFHE